MTYDFAGNLIMDTYTGYGTSTFDAENRMTSAANSSSGTSYYTYDAEGRRTRRKPGLQETWQIYGFDGELLAEYAAGNTPNLPQKEYGYRNGELLIVSEGTTNTTTNDTVWVEDSLPTGATTSSGGWNEAWNWVTSNPTPASGSKSDQTPITAGLHQQYFEGATQTLLISAGDKFGSVGLSRSQQYAE